MSRPIHTRHARLGACAAAVALTLTLGACHDGSSSTATAPATVAEPASTLVPATSTAPASTTTVASTATTVAATTAAAPTPPTPAPATAPVGTATVVPTTPAPTIDARAYAVYDATNREWLAGSEADTPMAVGSLMKLLTGYVVTQAGDPTHIVTVPDLQIDPTESAIGLYAGEQLQRDVLVRAMLIISANDAARALAIDLAGSEAAFADQMNAAAAALGLTSTAAANPVGLDAPLGFSTAHDMTTLAATLMQDDTFRTTVACTDAELHGQVFPATNGLLTTYPGAIGVKTGHTATAGWCIVGAAERDGRQVIVTVLGAPSASARLAGAAALLDWAFAQP